MQTSKLLITALYLCVACAGGGNTPRKAGDKNQASADAANHGAPPSGTPGEASGTVPDTTDSGSTDGSATGSDDAHGESDGTTIDPGPPDPSPSPPGGTSPSSQYSVKEFTDYPLPKLTSLFLPWDLYLTNDNGQCIYLYRNNQGNSLINQFPSIFKSCGRSQKWDLSFVDPELVMLPVPRQMIATSTGFIYATQLFNTDKLTGTIRTWDPAVKQWTSADTMQDPFGFAKDESGNIYAFRWEGDVTAATQLVNGRWVEVPGVAALSQGLSTFSSPKGVLYLLNRWGPNLTHVIISILKDGKVVGRQLNLDQFRGSAPMKFGPVRAREIAYFIGFRKLTSRY